MAQGCTIFVGNIDFDVPEEKVIESLSTIGKVVSFRMMYDRNTGKSKGYGFAEYESPLIAEQAVQSLKLVFNGRPIKINYAESDLPKKSESELIDVLEIQKAIDLMDKENIKKVLIFLKKLSLDQPNKLKKIFEDNKSTLVALYMCLLKMKLVDSSTIEKVVNKCFSLDDKELILKRIQKMEAEDLDLYPEEVRNRLKRIKKAIKL